MLPTADACRWLLLLLSMRLSALLPDLYKNSRLL
jgi:hypothetical protein